ncbi:MAG: hypothetical protein NWQ54_22245 [Paraglaciecola sp.]|nr:hypothetical protein [Paraglaciecola sp.]
MASQKNIYQRTTISKWLYRSSKISIAGRFVCNKNEEPLFFQSYLELGVLRHLALNKSIVYMDSQKGSTKWRPEGSHILRTYTPDIITTNNFGEITFIEIKPKIKITASEKKRLDGIKKAFEDAGYLFKTLTDKDVTYEMFVNSSLLLQSNNNHFEPSFLEVIVESLSATLPKTFTLKELKQELELFNFPICHLALIKDGYFLFDEKKILSPSTKVWRAV